MFLNMDPVLKTFYAYLWLRADGTPYYAGKGHDNRAWRHQKPPYPPTDSSRILILRRDSEHDAFETEKELIRNWGRIDLGTGCLYNRTEGGEGCSEKGPKALRAALENVKKATAAIKGKPKTAEQKRRISIGHKGLQKSKKWCQHISEAKQGKRIQKLQGANNAQWGKQPANVDSLRTLNASRPRDARGRFFNDKP